ncbi:MAG: hypothetical protein A2666_02905 [Parcubacteria group bacterium RIFCSPHIGHO2_01_FULL_47_10b]|nr:MAG: hypothetical protein A2666_02905 [Parcubacteria group bacterium RIFCSPHIGHO2_01_FULL_47_10b]
MSKNTDYDVLIIGGGVTGTALLYALSNYTNVQRMGIIEKYDEFGEVSTHYNNNSQTLHFGDIETNYTLEKATRVKEAADMLTIYLHRYAKNAFVKGGKMVIAVGNTEIQELEKRYSEFKELFPKLKKLDRDELEKIEPKLIEKRSKTEKLLALYTDDGYAVNYKKLAQSYVKESLRSSEARVIEKRGRTIDTLMNTTVQRIEKAEGGFQVVTTRGTLRARAVAVTAGPYSLVFAKQLGYGKEMGLLPVAGSFYCGNNLLRGKVYTMQVKKLPFAAIHGDPDVNDGSETRFGPTAKVLPMLERYDYKSVRHFFKVSVWTIRGVISLFRIIADWTIFTYIVHNFLFDIPIVGKWLFLQKARKIVPSLKYMQLRYGKHIGGIRPQVVNTKTMKMEMGEAEIVGDKILFNITPSPGASVSLKNAEQDALKIIQFLKPHFQFDKKRWCRDFESTMVSCSE